MNVGATLGVLAELRGHRGHISEARQLGHEALKTYRSLENQPLIAEELTRLARYEISSGKLNEARTLLRGAVEHLKMSFHARYIARCFEVFACLALETRAYDRAARFLGFSEQLRETYRLPLLPAAEREHAVCAEATLAGLSRERYSAESARGRALDLAAAFDETKDI